MDIIKFLQSDRSVREKKLALLHNTVNHFNLKNRSVNKGCHYSRYSLADHTQSEGCAIGRLLADDIALRFDALQLNKKFTLQNIIENTNYMPEYLKTLGTAFLQLLQNLHDSVDNWTDTGISDEGKTEACIIKKLILNDGKEKII